MNTAEEWVGPEATLDELLADEIIRAMMRADGVEEATIRTLIMTVALQRPDLLADRQG